MQLTNQNLSTFGIKLCATMPINFFHVAAKYVWSKRTLFVETKQIIHGAWWCTYLHTYLLLQERDVRGAKKHMRERRISFISCLATKKKTVLHSSFFFSYFMLVHSKSNDKLISSLAWNSFYYHLKTENIKTCKLNHWKLDNNGKTFWNHWVSR